MRPLMPRVDVGIERREAERLGGWLCAVLRVAWLRDADPTALPVGVCGKTTTRAACVIRPSARCLLADLI